MMDKEFENSKSFILVSDEKLDWNIKGPYLDIENKISFEPDYIPFLNFWKGLLDLGYFFLLIPFRLKRSITTGKLELYFTRTQQILCGIVQTFVLYDYISLFRSATWDNISSNISYLTSASYVGYVAYHLSLNWTFWFKRERFRNLFVKMQNVKFYSETSNKRIPTIINFVSHGFCAAVIFMALTDSSLVNNLYAKGLSFHNFYDDLSRKAKLHFLFYETDTQFPNAQDDCFLHQFVTFIRILILLPSLLLVPFLDIFVLMIPFSVWRIMCEFRKFCKNNAGSPLASEKILEKYWIIKKLLQELNRAIGLLLCCCVSVSLPYYAAWTGVFVVTDVHPVTLFHVYGFFLIFFLALMLAADVNKKGADFFSWISSPEHTDNVPTKTLTSLLVDLHSNQIALKGNGFFQISYRFLGTLFGVIVTYSIITIQIQLSRKGYVSGCQSDQTSQNATVLT